MPREVFRQRVPLGPGQCSPEISRHFAQSRHFLMTLHQPCILQLLKRRQVLRRLTCGGLQFPDLD